MTLVNKGEELMNAGGQVVGYCRVSSIDQNPERQQMELLSKYSLDRVFCDKASGKDVQRPQLQAALLHLREGDHFVVASMDRLARNLDDLRKIVKELTAKGVAVEFLKEALVFRGEDSPMSLLLLNVMGAFAEFERSLIRERQREGIEVAKNKGVYRGRRPSIGKEALKLIHERLAANLPKAQIAKEFGVSRETLYRYLRGDTMAEVKANRTRPDNQA